MKADVTGENDPIISLEAPGDQIIFCCILVNLYTCNVNDKNTRNYRAKRQVQRCFTWQLFKHQAEIVGLMIIIMSYAEQM
jgi:hypothetical protein